MLCGMGERNSARSKLWRNQLSGHPPNKHCTDDLDPTVKDGPPHRHSKYLTVGGPHIVKDEVQVEHQLSMLYSTRLWYQNLTLKLKYCTLTVVVWLYQSVFYNKIEGLQSKSTIKRFQDSYANSFENSDLKRNETSAFKNILNSNNDSASSFWLGLPGAQLQARLLATATQPSKREG